MTPSMFRAGWLTLALLLVPFYARADFATAPNGRLLGPTHPTKDYYEIGRERLKLKALFIEASDARDIKDAVEYFRKTKGTHNWEWKIGYVNFTPRSHQTLVLAWYNLDSNETGWQAATRDDSGTWLRMSHRTEKWAAFPTEHEIRKDITNGFAVVMRVSKANQLRLAYAFSKKE